MLERIGEAMKSKDAVIIHGMFSCSLAMRPFARALEKRGIYRKIHLVDIQSWTHRKAPQVYAEQNAKRIAEQLDRKVSKRALTSTIDVIGHSNGGYVAIFLKQFLYKADVDLTFTVASPKGLPQLAKIDVLGPHRRKLIHFRGGVDGVPFGFNHNPGEGKVVITFPDEGHSSIHLDADRNGLADVIAWANGKSLPHLFVDESKVIHVWQFCGEEMKQSHKPTSPMRASIGYSVCNGIHDEKLDSLKAEKKYWDVLFSSAPKSPATVGAYAVARLQRYIRMRALLNEHLDRVRSAMNYAKIYGKALKAELDSLSSQSNEISSRVEKIDKRIEVFYSSARKRHKLKLDRAIHPLSVARSICEFLDSVGDSELNGITALFSESKREFERYFQESMTKAIGQE